MRPCELKITCKYCDQPIYATDSLPDPSKSSGHHDFTYSWVPLCFIHTMEFKEQSTSRRADILVCEKQGIARLDRDRASGDCLCECGMSFRRHPTDLDHPYMNVLCDGSVVKL